MQATRPTVDERILERGRALWSQIDARRRALPRRLRWEDRFLAWATRDPSFKTDLFRFVDVLPALRSHAEVAAHVGEYLLKEGRALPLGLEAMIRAASTGATAAIAAPAIRHNVESLALRFIAGRDAGSALPVLERLHDQAVAFTVDLLGEKTVSDAEADAYVARCMEVVEALAERTARFAPAPVLQRSATGPLPLANVSVKLSAMDPHLDPSDTAGAVARLKRRALPLLTRACALGVFVNIDLEEWALHGITYDLFEELLGEPDLQSYPHLGIVVQAYLRTAAQDLERLRELVHRRGTPITVRLVKGAYWDYETTVAKQRGWPSPVFATKAETDASYEQLTATLLSHADLLAPAFGSHNLRSLLHALVLAEARGLPKEALEVQMLFGMAEAERCALVERGYRVRVYAPVGELLPGMAYLVRRLLENTSNEGFLRLRHAEGRSMEELLAAPAPEAPAKRPGHRRMMRGDVTTPFESCPWTDFSDSNARDAFARAVTSVGASLPRSVAVAIDGHDQEGSEIFERPCPSDTGRVVARVCVATAAQAEKAVDVALRAWPAWRERPLRDRAELLERLASRLDGDRAALAALQVWECDKPWREADADVAEAVDFCRYYARQALRELSPRALGQLPGEDNAFWYEGRGPCAVIAPWNFPLAILCGMTGAALVAGNTVLMKPAEQSSAVARALYEHLRGAGFPGDVVQLLPGWGEVVGAALVDHPRVATIAFTGSRDVGLGVLRKAAEVLPGQRDVKRVVCEMGGKNAIVVDEDADLDEAVPGIVHSAFGYAGQKCSAASRVIAVGGVATALLPRLVEAMQSLPVGPAHAPSTVVPAVIDAAAHARLRTVIESPGPGARALFVGRVPDGGWFVPPALFEVDDLAHPLLHRELFGPILAVVRVRDFSAALEVATSTEYALTGAAYSRTPSHLAHARRAFRVGNLYLNRGSTGSLVGRQPFGGFGMSGGGSKAGGPGYLTQFANPRVVTENTMRRGFVPQEPE
jgi:RHH-type transcriptional regulator, proline utilization regulon repressor / proline dehydrogenase / delta 1-pyrroline-5-carboxylate dehydrogenase